ncbi:MAG: hypothetical protein ABIR66_00055 [Saprospiraceae bacterium]
MKKYFFLLIPFFTLYCTSPRSEFERIFSQTQQDSLLTNIITYVYINAPGSTDSTKWLPVYRSFYEKNLNRFSIKNYRVTKDGWQYFFMIRPVGSGEKQRGVIGKFRLNQGSLFPIDFEEIINTPHLTSDEVKERGQFLFNKLMEQGNLDKYMMMKHYIEWPDSTLVYDKKIHQWVVPVH